MNKNDVINKVITELMSQRSVLNREIAELNHNESSYMEKRMTLENQIRDIDMNVSNHVMNLELTPIQN